MADSALVWCPMADSAFASRRLQSPRHLRRPAPHRALDPGGPEGGAPGGGESRHPGRVPRRALPAADRGAGPPQALGRLDGEARRGLDQDRGVLGVPRLRQRGGRRRSRPPLRPRPPQWRRRRDELHPTDRLPASTACGSEPVTKPQHLTPYDNVLDTIGWTPLIRLARIGRGIKTPIYGKAEYVNPGASVKDRIGLAIIEDAEQRGDLKLGGVIVEG